MKRTWLTVLLVISILLAACGQAAETPPAPTATEPPVSTDTSVPLTKTAAPTRTPTEAPSPTSTPTSVSTSDWSGPLAGKGWQLTVDYNGILIYDLDTLAQQRLTSWDGAQYPPRWAWSPDGERIYYEDQIVILATGETLDLSGLLGENPSAGGVFHWHPLGKAALYGGVLIHPDSGALIMPVTEVAPYRGGWSHAGQKLAFVSWDNFLSLVDVPSTDGEENVYSITHDSCGVQDNSRLVCLGAGYRSESPNAQILAEAETLSRIEDVQWSPVMDRLVFSTQQQELYLYDPASGDLFNLTQGFLAGNDMRFMGGFEWSPDGQSVTFGMVPAGGGYPQVYLIKVFGDINEIGEISEVTGGDYPYGAFAIWSPDGQWVVYSSYSPESGGQIIARKVTGSEWVSLPPEMRGIALEFRPGKTGGTVAATCDLSWSRLAVGGYAEVTEDSPAANRVRSEPVIGDNVIASLGPGMVSKVVEGPVCVDEYVFWKVENATIPGGSGWTAEGDGKDYWLAPYGSMVVPASQTPVSTATATPTPKPTATPTPKPTITSTLPTTSAAATWSKLSITAPTPWRGMTIAYDTNRKVVVLFGGTGETGRVLNETWEFDGQSWKKIAAAHTPPARFWHGMAYDQARGKVVLYGGWQTDNGYALSDTWEYDGKDWTQIQVTGPEARGYGPGMVYDTCRKKVVLFGGSAGYGEYYNDTWEYDGAAWKQVATQNAPSKRGLTAMTFDSTRCVSMLFGGINNGVGYNDTWEYNGVNWSKVTTTPAPAARWAHALAYDPLKGRVLLFGGYTPGTGKQVNDTWVYDGKAWLKLQPAVSPSAREQHVLVFDGSRVLLYGGYGYRETWQFK